jgi:hypothetical protein
MEFIKKKLTRHVMTWAGLIGMWAHAFSVGHITSCLRARVLLSTVGHFVQIEIRAECQ